MAIIPLEIFKGWKEPIDVPISSGGYCAGKFDLQEEDRELFHIIYQLTHNAKENNLMKKSEE